MFVMFGMNFLADFGRVLQPILWEYSGKVKNPKDAFNNTKRMAIYITLVTAMLIPLVQVGYVVVVKLILPKYIGSIPLFFILSNMLCLVSMAKVPTIILNSVVVSKQTFVTGVYAIGAEFSVFHGFFYSSTILSPWFLSVISILFQTIIWYFIILLFYRDYITKDKIVSIIKEVYELASAGIKRKISVLI